MKLDTLRKAAALLRHGDELDKMGGVVDVAKAVQHGASEAGGHLVRSGHPLLGLAATAAPLAGAAYVGKKGYEGVKRKIDEIKYRRMMRQQGMM